MKNILRSLVVLLTLATVAPAQKLVLPAEVKGEPGAFVPVPAETDGKHVRWLVIDSGLNLFPVALLKDSKTAVVSTAKPGRYRLAAYTAAGDIPSEPSVCVVVIGGVPPGPEPPPTPPADPLVQELQTLYDADTGPEKAKQKASLAALFRQAAPYADDPALATLGALHAKIKAAAVLLLPPGSIVGVQKRLAAEIEKSLSNDPETPLTPSFRAAASKLFTRFSVALEQVK